MNKLEQYLIRNAFRSPIVEETPNPKLGIVVVIPAYDEEDLIPSIQSLQQCLLPKSSVEIIVVFNASEKSNNSVILRNHSAKVKLEKWYGILRNPIFQLHVLVENQLPKKHAGVGLARKIGMDEAVSRFMKANNTNGIIVCFDADSKCKNNYFIEIEKHFQLNPKSGACSIHFEHPVNGDVYPNEVYTGISYYELHLRYYKNGLVYANLPFAFHTIGSSMAVNVLAYCEQGGMNRRKAGEDFYFLQKFIDIGSLTELKTTTVIPSPRMSHRVPFGTGRAIQEMLDSQREIEKSYSFECFRTLKSCFQNIPHFYVSNEPVNKLLLEFVGKQTWNKKLNEIRGQSASVERFEKRFFQWFNAFQTLKFIHFLRDNYFENRLLDIEVVKLLEELTVTRSERSLLEELRKLDKF